MPASPPIIEVNGLSKRYQLGNIGAGTLREELSNLWSGQRRKEKKGSFWALRDVSFQVAPGEVIGIIGRNGAGKSTLLKILSRITEPTEGEAILRGRVASLLEVGTGFHPQLTGRENIYLNGAILGLKRREITQRFDAIVDFAGMARHIDTPVKRYSSGQRVRLAFSVAAHLEPEILIVDEVLAVGDAAFQSKCLGKLRDLAQGVERTVLFVSHNLGAVENLCSRAIFLEDGRIRSQGDTLATVQEYLAANADRLAQSLDERTDRKGGDAFRFTEIQTLNPDGSPGNMCTPVGQPLVLRLRYENRSPETLRNVYFNIAVKTNLGTIIAFLNSTAIGKTFDLPPGQGEMECRIENSPFSPGIYNFNLVAKSGDRYLDWIVDAAQWESVSGDFYGSGKLPPQFQQSVLLPLDWKHL